MCALSIRRSVSDAIIKQRLIYQVDGEHTLIHCAASYQTLSGYRENSDGYIYKHKALRDQRMECVRSVRHLKMQLE